MTKHERAISLIDVSLDQMGILLINTYDKTDLLAKTLTLLQQRNQLIYMELTEISAYNEGSLL